MWTISWGPNGHHSTVTSIWDNSAKVVYEINSDYERGLDASKWDGSGGKNDPTSSRNDAED